MLYSSQHIPFQSENNYMTEDIQIMLANTGKIVKQTYSLSIKFDCSVVQ